MPSIRTLRGYRNETTSFLTHYFPLVFPLIFLPFFKSSFFHFFFFKILYKHGRHHLILPCDFLLNCLRIFFNLKDKSVFLDFSVYDIFIVLKCLALTNLKSVKLPLSFFHELLFLASNWSVDTPLKYFKIHLSIFNVTLA